MKTRFVLPAALLALVAACTKTKTLPVPARGENRMLSYTITSVPDGAAPVIGAIDDTDSTITVYISAYYGLTAMTPEITVPEGATVSPASGTTVTNLLSMMRKDSTITYMVTAKNGSKKSYTLHVRSLQPKTVVNEISTSIDNPKSVTIYPKYGANGYGSVALKGSNFITKNRSILTSMTFTDSANNVIDVPYAGEGSEGSLTSIAVNYRISPTNTEFVNKLVNNAIYYVTFYNYGEEIKLKYPIRFRISN
ncbi:MAG TPA: hypothetical protein VJ647_03410 [Chitinophagaceae bacterium]|nr:hypothetical protein [Chitinophagaceae bacterium]